MGRFFYSGKANSIIAVMISTIRLKRNGKISGIKIISITHTTKKRKDQEKSITFSNSNIPNMISIIVIIVDLVCYYFFFYYKDTTIIWIMQIFGKIFLK